MGRAFPEIRMQDGAEFCLPGELLTYGPINAVIGQGRDNIYLEKPVVGDKWPHLQLRQVGVSALAVTWATHPKCHRGRIQEGWAGG